MKFWIKLRQKGYFRTRKMNIAIELYIFKLIYILNLSFNKQFWFLEQISKKKYTSGRKHEKMNITIHIRISLSTDFQLKLTIEIFWTKVAKKGSYFIFLKHKIDITIEFCIFELVFVSNFTLNKQFWIFGPNLSKKEKQKT